ncbi:MAG: hypothetical protein FRX49_04135 [Trebouxia sp. A1-2]|nr:MAG: hypothetical protein FRX49_04135 [Trebouxia sp. A1-2]
MSRRFIPDERCLGGVQEIHADYTNMRRKLLTAKPQAGKRQRRPTHHALPSYAVAAADRLSSNRALKLAATDAITLNHIRNIYHMHRRMDETDRRQFKAEVKAECEPYQRKRSNQDSLAFSLTSWIPRQQQQCSLCSAEPTRSSITTLMDPTTPLPCEGPLTPYRHLQPTSIGKQPQGSYHSQRLRSSYTAFKIAVLSEIIDKQLYEERQLRRLFRAYLTHNSLADMQVVRMVIADLQVEMNVQLS